MQRYLIVPSTWEPDEEGHFLLRVWSPVPIAAPEDASTPSSGTSYNYPTWNTRRDRDSRHRKIDHSPQSRSSRNRQETGANPLLAYDGSPRAENGRIVRVDENPKVLTRMSTQLSDVQNRSAYKILKSYAGRVRGRWTYGKDKEKICFRT